MRKLVLTLLNTTLFLSVAGMAFAADGAGLSSGSGLAILGMVVGLGLAAAGCGLAQGNVVKASCEGIARNPDASGKLFMPMILGLAFVESLCIYALVIDFLLLGKV